VQVEEDLRVRWSELCHAAGVPLTELAEHYLGVSRADLYESFEGGARHPRLAHLELLPRAAQLAYLRARAGDLGYELRPTAGDHASLSELAAEVGRSLTAIASTEADGHVGPAEALTDLAALDRLEAVIASVRAHRRAAVEHRGLRVAGRVG
jgi:hypothetical protein